MPQVQVLNDVTARYNTDALAAVAPQAA